MRQDLTRGGKILTEKGMMTGGMGFAQEKA